MQCAISGVPPTTPVVSSKSGAIFEKDLIIQYINEHHKDPISSDPLAVEDLIEIRQSPFQPPRQPTLNSIPSLLSSLQNEWDSVALELFQLRKQLDETRKELSTALYHHDAAVRVAAQAVQERDKARNALQELTISISNGNPVESAPTATSIAPASTSTESLESTTIERITTANVELFTQHKSAKQKVNVQLSSALSSIQPITQANKSPGRGVSEIQTSLGEVFAVSAAGVTYSYTYKNDSYNKRSFPKLDDISNVMEIKDTEGTEYSVVSTYNKKLFIQEVEYGTENSIMRLVAHPSISDMVIAVEQYQTIGVYTLQGLAYEIEMPKSFEANKAAAIHPDGALFAVGADSGTVLIFDLRSKELVKTLAGSGPVKDILFGKNGYWLYVSDGTSTKIWDLRKDSHDEIKTSNRTVALLSDKSGQLLISVYHKGIEIFQYNKKAKEWSSKGDLEAQASGQFITGHLIDDSEPDKLTIGLVSSDSAVQQFVVTP